MKVVVVTNRIASATPTGVERYARELATALHARTDVSCEILAPAERNEPVWAPPGLRAAHLPLPRKVNLALWCAVHRPHIDRFATTPDLVHVAAPTFPIPSTARVVYTVHDVLPLLHPEWFEFSNRFGFRLAMRDIRQRAAAVIADSTATAEALIASVGIERSRITVVPLGVSRAFLDGVSHAESREAAASVGVELNSFAIAVGEITHRKNLSVVVNAIARMRRPIPIVLVGPEGLGAEVVRSETERLGISKLVRFVGFIPDAKLAALVAAARVLVQPSRAEGFGFPPLEALAVGTPAIVATTAALPEIIGDAALLADPDDADSWAEAIEAMSNPDQRETVAARGLVHARSFTWEKTAEETVAVYRSVLEHGRG